MRHALIDTAEWQRIDVRRCQRLFGSTERVECADGSRLTFNSGMTASGSSADARGILHECGEARVLVDGSRIVGVGRTNPTLHPHTRSIMEAFDIDVAGVVEWALSPLIWVESEAYSIECPEMGVVLDGDDRVMLTWAMEGFAITHEDVYLNEKLPEAIVAASVGRLLREVISIPEIDHLDIPILAAEVTPINTRFVILPDVGGERLSQ